MVMRSFTVVRLVVPMKSRTAAEGLKKKAERRFGHQLHLRRRGRTLMVAGDGISNYKVRNWILNKAVRS